MIGRKAELYEIVRDGDMRLDRDARRVGQEPSLFAANMRKAGYPLPEASI